MNYFLSLGKSVLHHLAEVSFVLFIGIHQNFYSPGKILPASFSSLSKSERAKGGLQEQEVQSVCGGLLWEVAVSSVSVDCRVCEKQVLFFPEFGTSRPCPGLTSAELQAREQIYHVIWIAISSFFLEYDQILELIRCRWSYNNYIEKKLQIEMGKNEIVSKLIT